MTQKRVSKLKDGGKRSDSKLRKVVFLKTSKILGLVQDGLGGVGGSFLINFGGFSKNFEQLKFPNLKIAKQTSKIRQSKSQKALK